jgi:hypothetical protein
MKKTKISYQYDGRFFDPKLRTINFIQLGKSPIIYNPFVILFEWLYVKYKHLRERLTHLKNRLFPRRNKIWCDLVDSHITGHIHYAERSQLNIPIHSLKVELWARTYWMQWRKLGESFTDLHGAFSVPYQLRQARSWQIKRVQFEVYQTSHAFLNGPAPKIEYARCYKQKLPISELTGMRYNLRTIHLHLWEYRRDSRIPRTLIIDEDTNSPQYYTQGRLDALYQQVTPLEITKQKHLLQIAKSPESISILDIQNDYPENLTVCIEKAMPGYTRSDEWFGKRMMNGMNYGSFLPDKNTPGHYWIKYFGICNYDHNNQYALPTVDIKFKLGDDGLPLPIEIHLTGQLNVYDKNPWQKHVFTPESGEAWLHAKRVARVTGAFSTEVDEHFTGTHLNTEQYAIAAYRNFRRSPLAWLMFPHLKEVALVNHGADSFLIHGYIPTATALTEAGLYHRTFDLMGMQDWKNWKPMEPLNPSHTSALAGQLFWKILRDYIDRFFDIYGHVIQEYWYEVYLFSNDLVTHSVPVFLSEVDLEALSPEEKQLAEDRMEYYQFKYAFDPNVARETINGELKAVSPITKSTWFKTAAPEDWQNIKDACCYMIMMATFQHTWINEHQYDDLGEVLYSSGGLRFGDKPSGIMAPESDLGISPDRTRATQMLWFTNFLSRTEYGFIMKNEEGDVNPMFSQMLLEHEEAFAKLGVDIHAIESRTNI